MKAYMFICAWKVITQPCGGMPDSDIIGTIHKGQRSNPGECRYLKMKCQGKYLGLMQ